MATTAKQSNSRNPSATSSSKVTNTQASFTSSSSSLSLSPTSSKSISSTLSSLSSSAALSSPSSSSSSNSPLINSLNQRQDNSEEDIETIAKQISDHAEVIYQTWKARGLAPTEILNCHSMHSDAFDKTLTPFQRNKELPTNEIMSQSPVMSNTNLKKLVNSFVTEDKARQQTNTRKTNILTSGTIRDALKKFENNDCSTNVKPNYLRYSINKKSTQVAQQKTDITQKEQHQQKETLDNNKIINNVPDVLINTIEKKELVKTDPLGSRVKPETPAKPANLLNHTPSWPLKNNNRKIEVDKKTTKSKVLLNGEEKNSQTPPHVDGKINQSNNLMDEVLMEEERLINALKTGTVLNNDKILPEVITSTLAITNKLDSGGGQLKPDPTDSKPAWGNDLKTITTHETDNGLQQVKFSLKPRGKNEASVPHPDINTHINKNSNSNGTNSKNAAGTPATRPFLTRGSVAERVLMFEKCPEIKALRSTPREASKLAVSTNFSHMISFAIFISRRKKHTNFQSIDLDLIKVICM